MDHGVDLFLDVLLERIFLSSNLVFESNDTKNVMNISENFSMDE